MPASHEASSLEKGRFTGKLSRLVDQSSAFGSLLDIPYPRTLATTALTAHEYMTIYENSNVCGNLQ